MFSALALSPFTLHSLQHPIEWILVWPLCLRLPAHLGDDLPHGNGVVIGYTATVSSIVEWAESSCSPMVCDGMMHCPLLAALHVSYIYYGSFLKCNQFLYGFSCQLLVSWLVLADGDVVVDVAVPLGGRVALSSSSWAVCLWALGSVHMPQAPHWVPEFGCCRFTTPFGRGGSCTVPTVVDNNLTDLFDMK